MSLHVPAARTKSAPSGQHAPASEPVHLALVRVITAEDAEYCRLQVDLLARRRRIADLETEIAPLLNAFEAFERTYETRIGPVQRELRETEQKIGDFEAKIARIHARMVADPDGLLGDLFSRDELREIGDFFGVDASEWFEEGEDASARGSFDDAEEFVPLRARNRRSDEVETELRTRYHTLARRFHPDLATDEADRARRQAIMLRVNTAWQERDLHTLRELCHQTEHDEAVWAQRTTHERVAWARTERSRLDQTIANLVARLHHLRSSSTLPLWMNPALAETVIIRRLAHFGAELEIAKARLASVQEAFRKALASFALDLV